jgi:hypothetical protein
MEPETGEIHILRSSSAVQNGEDIFNLLQVFRLNASGLAIFKEPLQPPVPEVWNHITIFA